MSIQLAIVEDDEPLASFLLDGVAMTVTILGDREPDEAAIARALRMMADAIEGGREEVH